MLRGFGKGVFNGLSREVAKAWTKTGIVGFPLDNEASMQFKMDDIGRDDEILKLLMCVQEVFIDSGPVDKEGLSDVSKFIKHWIYFGWRICEGIIPLCVIISVVVKDRGIPVAVRGDEYMRMCIILIVCVGLLLDIR